MFCKQCGAQLPEGAVFCPSCGMKQDAPQAQQAPPQAQPQPQQQVQQQAPPQAQPQPQQQAQQQAPPQQPYQQPGYQQGQYQQPGYQQYQQPPKESFFKESKAGPSAGSVNFGEAIKLFLQNYINFEGRASKSEFWWAFLFQVLIGLVIWIPVVGQLVSLALFLPALSIGVRRLHDIGKEWYWILMGLIPIAGIIILIVYWVKDSVGDNQWGPNPYFVYQAPQYQQPGQYQQPYQQPAQPQYQAPAPPAQPVQPVQPQYQAPAPPAQPVQPVQPAQPEQPAPPTDTKE